MQITDFTKVNKLNSKKLFLLEKENYKKIQKAFNLERITLKSIIFKNTTGIIYVDSLENPQTALIWDCNQCFFILGDKIDENLYEFIKEILFNNFFIKAKNREIMLDYELECFSKNVEHSIIKIFSGFPLMLNKRRYYSLDLSEEKNIGYDIESLIKKRIFFLQNR